MNYPQRMLLRITGFMLFVLALTFIIYSTPYAQDIRIADSICNAEINVMGYDVEIGQYAQNILNNREECVKVHFLRLGVDYSWVVLVVGVVMFFIGIWAGLGDREKKEILGKQSFR